MNCDLRINEQEALRQRLIGLTEILGQGETLLLTYQGQAQNTAVPALDDKTEFQALRALLAGTGQDSDRALLLCAALQRLSEQRRVVAAHLADISHPAGLWGWFNRLENELWSGRMYRHTLDISTSSSETVQALATCMFGTGARSDLLTLVSLLVTPPAFDLLQKKCLNPSWLASVLGTGFNRQYRARPLPLELPELEQAMLTIRNRLSSLFPIPSKPLDQWTAAEVTTRLCAGLILIERPYVDNIPPIINPIFQSTPSEPAS